MNNFKFSLKPIAEFWWMSGCYLSRKYRRIYNRLLGLYINHRGYLNIHPSAAIVNPHCINIGDNFQAGRLLRLEAICKYGEESFSPKIVIGNNVTINDLVHIGCNNYIEIGNDVLIASKVYISDHSHGCYDEINSTNVKIPPSNRPLTANGKVIIEDKVWIGDSVCILPGVKVSYGSIIGSNSVVNQDIPAKSIAVGAPARVVKVFCEVDGVWKSI